MSNVLKVKVAGQRIRYQVSKVTFSDDDLLKANEWRWDDKKKSLIPNDNKLDIIRDYETFDCVDAGVAIRANGDIYYELGDTKGKILNHNVLSALTHPILTAIRSEMQKTKNAMVTATFVICTVFAVADGAILTFVIIWKRKKKL